VRSNRRAKAVIEEHLGIGAVEECMRYMDELVDSPYSNVLSVSEDEMAAQEYAMGHLVQQRSRSRGRQSQVQVPSQQLPQGE
jgi:hypothetical protein